MTPNTEHTDSHVHEQILKTFREDYNKTLMDNAEYFKEGEEFFWVCGPQLHLIAQPVLRQNKFKLRVITQMNHL